MMVAHIMMTSNDKNLVATEILQNETAVKLTDCALYP